MKIGDIEYPSLKGKVSDAEWRTRVELAALYRLIPLMGWWDLVMAPASARVEGEPDHYLFTPLGFLFEEMTASALVKITLDGDKVSDTPLKISRGNWLPMKAIHEVRADADWVIHTHDDYGLALSARKERLQPVSQAGGFSIVDKVAYHDYEGVETHEERIPGLQKSLGDANRMILHNHGLLTLGRTAWEALQRMSQLTKACRVQLLAGRSEELIHIPAAVMATFAAELTRTGVNDYPWPGLLRKLDRLDPTYKD